MSFIEIRPPKKAVVVTCFSIVVLSIGIWILAFGVIMRAVGDREQLARRILAGYDDIISQYCKEVVEGDGKDVCEVKQKISAVCVARKCSIEALEEGGQVFGRCGDELSKGGGACLYVEHHEFPSETMYFSSFRRSDGSIVDGLTYVRRYIWKNRKIILMFKCQTGDGP